MESIRRLYRIGMGPSSSHTLAPREAAARFREQAHEAVRYKVILYGSLAATGEGHLTFQAIRTSLEPVETQIVLEPSIEKPFHPNCMEFSAFDSTGNTTHEWTVYSTGGGALTEEGQPEPEPAYDLTEMGKILGWVRRTGKPIWMYVEERESRGVWEYLTEVWGRMREAIERGLNAEGALPGALRLPRKAQNVFVQARRLKDGTAGTGFISAYALAAAEENAAGGMVVTAPTCGSCGVLPAVLRYIAESYSLSEERILRALATAGLIGNLVKHNASISGAAVGCQGEIGTACAMTAAAAAQLLGASPPQIEYAAEMGLEHHLGLTCDPVAGLVQIPCIERNAMAALRAYDCAEYALLSDGFHRVSFDQVVETMRNTGHDLPSLYRETAAGGLAATFPKGDVEK